MKAFVIKNKEGKYLYEDGYVKFGERLGYAHTEVEKEPLEKLIKDCKNILGDCEVVEITIAEGDLLQKIGELKDYIYSYNNEANNRTQVCNEYIDATCKDILEKMKELKL